MHPELVLYVLCAQNQCKTQKKHINDTRTFNNGNKSSENPNCNNNNGNNAS